MSTAPCQGPAPKAPHRRWRSVAASVEGSGHLLSGTPCQDAHAVIASDETLIIAVADGAGSAPRAQIGSAAAASFASEYAAHLLSEPHAEAIGIGIRCLLPRQVMVEVLAATRRHLGRVAARDRVPLKDLATTLLVVIAGHEGVVAAQVGDGAVVLQRGEGRLEVLGGTARGEYLNETCFLTSRAWKRELSIASVDADDVAAISVMTDGLQLLALEMATNTPHPGFFAPIHGFAASSEATTAELAAFLRSERVCSRTDDDKTLVTAVRA